MNRESTKQEKDQENYNGTGGINMEVNGLKDAIDFPKTGSPQLSIPQQY